MAKGIRGPDQGIAAAARAERRANPSGRRSQGTHLRLRRPENALSARRIVVRLSRKRPATANAALSPRPHPVVAASRRALALSEAARIYRRYKTDAFETETSRPPAAAKADDMGALRLSPSRRGLRRVRSRHGAIVRPSRQVSPSGRLVRRRLSRVRRCIALGLVGEGRPEDPGPLRPRPQEGLPPSLLPLIVNDGLVAAVVILDGMGARVRLETRGRRLREPLGAIGPEAGLTDRPIIAKTIQSTPGD